MIQIDKNIPIPEVRKGRTPIDWTDDEAVVKAAIGDVRAEDCHGFLGATWHDVRTKHDGVRAYELAHRPGAERKVTFEEWWSTVSIYYTGEPGELPSALRGLAQTAWNAAKSGESGEARR